MSSSTQSSTSSGAAGLKVRPALQPAARIVEQAQHLTLGDGHAEVPEQGGQARQRGLALVAERHHEALGAGADTFVAGSAIFGKPDYRAVIAAMREQLKA